MIKDPDLHRKMLERYGVSDELFESIVQAIANDKGVIEMIGNAHEHGIVESKSGLMHELGPAHTRANQIAASMFAGDTDLVIQGRAWIEAYRRIAATHELAPAKFEGKI